MGSDRITIEVIARSLEYIAEEMGIRLRNSAYSPNIKERMDHSCAIFDSEGRVLAQAEHIPTHLGSMAWGVKETLKYITKKGLKLEEGDVLITNNPYIAGTHLNDVLAIAPIYYDGELLGYVASKAHYVDVGGKVPGSIASDSIEVLEEGLLIPPIKVMERGRLRRDLLELILSNVRSPDIIIGDLKAQIAAMDTGRKQVLSIVDKYGYETTVKAFNEIIDYSRKITLHRVRKLPDFDVEAEDYLEDPGFEGDAVIHVRIIKKEERVIVDYTGSSPQVPAPLNAPFGVTIASTTFTLKTILDPELPVNDGFYQVVEIKAKPKTIVYAHYPAPVGASIETAQRIVDTMYLALAKAIPDRVPAGSCGSMNNLLIGGVDYEKGKTWAFYETIAGGYGGRKGLDGVNATHCNMTNTMNTPIEVIEHELPLLFTRYELRPSSGGAGKWRGGMGVIRSFKILAPQAKVTVIGERVKYSPHGILGGKPGKPARYYVVKRNGKKILLRSKDTVMVEYGDEVVIETAGGGGYGLPYERDDKLIIEDLLDQLIESDEVINTYGKGYLLSKVKLDT